MACLITCCLATAVGLEAIDTSPALFGKCADYHCESEDNYHFELAEESSMLQTSVQFVALRSNLKASSASSQQISPANRMSRPTNSTAVGSSRNGTRESTASDHTSSLLASSDGPLHSAATIPNSTRMLDIAALHNTSSVADPPDIKLSLHTSTVEIAALILVVFAATMVCLLDGPTSHLEESKKHSALYSIMGTHSHRPQAVAFRCFIAGVVLINIVVLVFATDPRDSISYQKRYEVLEGVTSWIFLVEYCMRIYVIPESNRYRNFSPCMARLSWMFHLEGLIDLTAMAPYFIEIVVTYIDKGSKISMPILTWLRVWLRVFRLFRLLKVGFISESIDVFARVLHYNAEILLVSLILCAVLLLFISVLLYAVAPPNDDALEFSSITACMYLAVMMLTGQGQPQGRLPWYTKIVVCITCMFAIGLFAIQASMLTWGFENEAERRIKKNRRLTEQRVKALLDGQDPNAESSSSSSEDEEEFGSDWEEYEENIAGDSEQSDSDDEQRAKAEIKRGTVSFTHEETQEINRLFSEKQCKVIKRIFYYLDIDTNGHIGIHELSGLEGFNAPKVFHLRDQNESNNISKMEFIEWLSIVKKKDSSVVFKMLLEDLLKACKNRREKEDEVEDEKALPSGLMDFAKQFKKLQQENDKLKRKVAKLSRKDSEGTSLKS